MKPQFFKAVFSASLLAVALIMSPKANAAPEVTLRLHQFLSNEANVPKHILAVWADNVEKASNGRIKIEQYGSMALGGRPPELYDQAVDGVADIIWTVAGYTPGRFPEVEVVELPFMMKDAPKASRALWQIAQDTLIDDEMADTHVLGLWVHGPGIIHSKKPIHSVADLRGVKLRAPTRTTTILFQNLGAEPIGMPVPAVPENLSKGVIDAAVIPWEVTKALKVPELVTNHTTFPDHSLYTTAFIFTMNKDKYENLPADLQKVIDDASGEDFSAFAAKVMVDYDEPSRLIAKQRGNNIIALSPDEIAKWQEASRATISQWIAEMNERGIDGQALIARAKKLMDQ